MKQLNVRLDCLEIALDGSDEIDLCIRAVATTAARNRTIGFLTPAARKLKNHDGFLELDLTVYEIAQGEKRKPKKVNVEAELHLDAINLKNFWGKEAPFLGIRVRDSFKSEDFQLSV